jgi:uncharacterized delta-60 repeat protein
MKRGTWIQWFGEFFLFVGLICSIARIAQAAPGDLDPTFGIGGKVSDGSLHSVYDLAVQPDGKIVLAGTRYFHPDATSWYLVRCLARYNSDGSLDTSFGTNGRVVEEESIGIYYAVTIQSDGKNRRRRHAME